MQKSSGSGKKRQPDLSYLNRRLRSLLRQVSAAAGWPLPRRLLLAARLREHAERSRIAGNHFSRRTTTSGKQPWQIGWDAMMGGSVYRLLLDHANRVSAPTMNAIVR